MKYVFIGLIILVGIGYAGNSDYEDHIIVEMKNNGEYYRLSEIHPNWTDKQLVEYYVRCSKDEAAR